MAKTRDFYKAQEGKSAYHVKNKYAENNLRKQKLFVSIYFLFLR